MIGNLIIILVIISDSHLHTPMYFFLSNLSFIGICFTTTTISKMLVNIQTPSKVITYVDCIIQMYFFMIFVTLDDFLLAMMAYDWYVAICHPLHYSVIMSPSTLLSYQICVLLVLLSWVMSFLTSLLHTLMTLQLSFCPPVEIPHFFCELNQVVHLTCSDTFLNDMVMNFGSMLLVGGPLSGILYS
ncbi:Olfactory receptor 7A10 [Tupaia chinensis]|uniref:Olfactory receptor 7A10 n=1 Tax=Tupaia chinensis TaxID=246437 RepID=L8Y619_TUPCH|nr:Olfactory receptor 7A10 [Tupaia chinensis]